MAPKSSPQYKGGEIRGTLYSREIPLRERGEKREREKSSWRLHAELKAQCKVKYGSH